MIQPLELLLKLLQGLRTEGKGRTFDGGRGGSSDHTVPAHIDLNTRCLRETNIQQRFVMRHEAARDEKNILDGCLKLF